MRTSRPQHFARFHFIRYSISDPEMSPLVAARVSHKQWPHMITIVAVQLCKNGECLFVSLLHELARCYRVVFVTQTYTITMNLYIPIYIYGQVSQNGATAKTVRKKKFNINA